MGIVDGRGAIADNKQITTIKRENKYDNTRTRPCLPSPTPSAG